MDPKDMTKHAMHAVLEDMGRAAREGKARRFAPRRVEAEVDLIGPHGEHMGNHLHKPANAEADDVAESMSPEDRQALMDELTIER